MVSARAILQVIALWFDYVIQMGLKVLGRRLFHKSAGMGTALELCQDQTDCGWAQLNKLAH